MNAIPVLWWQKVNRHDFLSFLLLLFTGVAAFLALVAPVILRADNVPLAVGGVAPQDYQAPRSVEYISDVRTEEARLTAERSVSDVYTTPDPSISRRQVDRLRVVLQYIDLIRVDEQATITERRAVLGSISDLPLSPEAVDVLLSMSDSRWQLVKTEALVTLDRVMRGSVRESNLETVRNSLPSTVSLTLTEDSVSLVVQLVRPYVVANSFFSQELTDAARQQARQSVKPITQAYVSGELIVPRGQVLSPADLEALQTLGLIRPRDPFTEYMSAAALVAAMATFLALYYHRRRPMYYNDGRSLLVVAVLFLLFLTPARFLVQDRIVFPYLYPLPAFSLLVATLFGPGGGLILSVVISIFAAYGLPNALDLSIYYMMMSVTGVLALGSAQRFSDYFWAALVASLVGGAIVIAYRIPSGTLDSIGFLTLLGAALLNNIASASLTIMTQYVLAEFLGLTTPLRLLDISRPDAPLLQYFLRNAPGTYQHSLMVSNLAEQAAEKLGMDTLLVRVGTLYHDIGKATNPSFFIENQFPDNLDTHEDMSPEDASAAIIRHVTDGVMLAKKHRLPRRMIDFILEHHGTLVTTYQYTQAVQQAGSDASKVDIEKFRYPGPRPRSRETALLMLSDNVEARARSERPRSEEQIRALVNEAFQYLQQEGQLAETRFTIKDLTIITESFVSTLRGVYHPRVRYPSAEPNTLPLKKTTSK